MLLPKQLSVDLWNVLCTVMASCTSLHLIKELTSQQSKCSNGLMLREFAGLSKFSTPLKQLAWQEGGRVFWRLSYIVITIPGGSTLQGSGKVLQRLCMFWISIQYMGAGWAEWSWLPRGTGLLLHNGIKEVCLEYNRPLRVSVSITTPSE